MKLPCTGLHHCRPWGWRLVAKSKHAHYFDVVPSETHLECYASPKSLCGMKHVNYAP